MHKCDLNKNKKETEIIYNKIKKRYANRYQINNINTYKTIIHRTKGDFVRIANSMNIKIVQK
ncbi:MAG: hypothetical protein KatS3mg068_2329 [Candidatus Sericytochromatia bacterium]|nr:MAG: hypothetical protein KatS3mg068_2329 [Candidatus Sericytochromatia bacterium]